VLALAEAYLQGVSTRKMKAVTESLMGKEFSSTSISRFASTLDAELDCRRERSFTKEYPYVVADFADFVAGNTKPLDCQGVLRV
ncbi:MAG: transposase, partial [Bacteroidales bacterium]